MIHDLIFSIGSFFLFLALVPSVMKRASVPKTTSALMGGVLFIFAMNYLSLGYFYTMAMTLGNVAEWAFLYLLAVRRQNEIVRT